MKILFLGQIGEGQTSLMRMKALRRLGHEVIGVHTNEAWMQASWFARQWQRRLQIGPVIDAINAKVLAAARRFQPELVWGEKQEYLRVETLHGLRNLGARLVHFTPDPYFFLDWKRTRLMDAAMKEFDALVYCKSYERTSYEAMGKPLVYMPLGYCDEVHRPLPSNNPRWHCDLGFLGGWEPRREELLALLVEAGQDLKIWGGYWDFLQDGCWSLRRKIILDQLAGGAAYRIHRNEKLVACWQGREVYADDYARALTGSKIGIGFLRKVCPDQHTTRTFEIPACGSMLLADRTPEHMEFFAEGKEAEFFSSKEEMLDKARFYSRNTSVRERIAQGGYDQGIKGGYSYIVRLRSVLSVLRLQLQVE